MPRIALTEPDLELLQFAAEHRFVLAEQAAVLLGVTPSTAFRRLDRLVDGGYVRRESVIRAHPPMHLIKPAGLRAVGSRLPTPRLDLSVYEHDVGVAWLWLAARRGTFGPVREVLAERTLRSRDAGRERVTEPRAPHDPEPLGVRLGGTGPRGRERLHYPDLLLQTADGRRVALELELSVKARTRLETILAGYGADPRIAGVVYLVPTQPVARAVERAARRVGVSHLVHLQRVRSKLSQPATPSTRALARAAEATPSARALARAAEATR